MSSNLQKYDPFFKKDMYHKNNFVFWKPLQWHLPIPPPPRVSKEKQKQPPIFALKFKVTPLTTPALESKNLLNRWLIFKLKYSKHDLLANLLADLQAHFLAELLADLLADLLVESLADLLTDLLANRLTKSTNKSASNSASKSASKSTTKSASNLVN